MRLMAMATSNTQKTIVSLNSKLALDELQKLKKQVEDLKKKKGDALKKTTTAGQSKMPKKIKQATATVKTYESKVAQTINTLSNMGTASVGEVKAAMKQLKKSDSCRVVGEEIHIPLLTLVEPRKGKLYYTF